MTIAQTKIDEQPGGVSRPRKEVAKFAEGCAWIDGELVPIREARIPVLDAGFLKSDLTYDSVEVWDGRLFRLDDHLARLEDGCARLQLTPPLRRDEMKEIILAMVPVTGLRRAFVWTIVTRGMPTTGLPLPGQQAQPEDPRLWISRFYALTLPYGSIVSVAQQEQGASAVVVKNTRRTPPDSLDPAIKNLQWGDLLQARFEASDRGATVAIVTDGSGLVTEGPGFNVFALIDGRLHTPARGVLEGITRMTVIELAQSEGIEVIVGDLPVELLSGADEILITSTAGGVMPITTLDSQGVGDGRPGPVTTSLREQYWKLHSNPDYTLAIDYSVARPE